MMLETRHYQGNPQKNSPALGATLAFLGINGLLALLHGSQGCSTFIRLQLSRHFREPIPLNSTAIMEDSVIFGGWEQLKQGIAKVADKYRPQIVGVMSTGLTETFGDDMPGALSSLRSERTDLQELPVVLTGTPDYIGSMQEGYQRAVLAIVDTIFPLLPDPVAIPPERKTGDGNEGQPEKPVAVLFPGCHLTPADIAELKEIVTLFGLHPVVLPDLSSSLDGHLEAHPAPVVQGGTTVTDMSLLPQAAAAFSFGLSMRKVGDHFQKICSVPHYHVPSISGLTATDQFVLTLSKLTGQPIPPKLMRQRSQLLDSMVDYHDQLAGLTVAAALESDLLYSLVTTLQETGASISLALAATPAATGLFPAAIPVRTGDLEELEECAGPARLIIANSNGRQAAAALKLPHLRAGLPVFDQAGYPQKVWVGYQGTQQFLFDTLNTLAG